jgi:hypothetical protein
MYTPLYIFCHLTWFVSRISCMLVRNKLTTIDRLLFGDDPRSLELGGEHKVLSYLRAWRPLFTYVCTTHYEFHTFKNTNTT